MRNERRLLLSERIQTFLKLKR